MRVLCPHIEACIWQGGGHGTPGERRLRAEETRMALALRSPNDRHQARFGRRQLLFRPFTCAPEIRRRTIWHSHRMSAPGVHDARSLLAMSWPEGSETNDLRSIQCELARGLMNPQHLELLSEWSELYRHLIAFTLTQHSPAQGGFAADDLDEFSAVEQLHVPPIRAEKDLLLLVV